MILRFLIGEEIELAVRVTDERELSFMGPNTNDKFVPFSELVGEADEEYARLAEAIVRDLKDIKDVRNYLKHEVMNNKDLRAYGVSFLGDDL